MGICNQQHRLVTGMNNAGQYIRRCIMNKPNTDTDTAKCILYTIGLVMYVYIICLILAMVGKEETAFAIKYVGYITNYCNTSHAYISGLRTYLNSGYITLITILLKIDFRRTVEIFKCFGCMSGKTARKVKMRILQRLGLLISCWLAVLNILLIVISNPSILNLGPSKDLSVLYQNVRGFVPFNSLGAHSLPLDTDKLVDFQSYIFEKNPDLVILNETWLTKDHFDNEIFPNNTYTVFRRDRSQKTHPVDLNNPNKFRRKGGGVLIAVKADLAVETKEIKIIKSKAEILSVELKFSATDIVCITTCYRVGTLGHANFCEIEKHLKSMAATKKYKKHVILGDFNLSQITWPEERSPLELERQFLDLFNDLGLDQIINTPTHEGGNTLDLLLTNVTGYAKNVLVLNKNEVCSSDHYGIIFKLGKVKLKSSKRKMYNYKKANWEEMNRDLNRVSWDSYLQYTDAESAWINFKKILFQIIDKHIPIVTIKDKGSPPWFDNDTFKLCRKKERLRSKYKQTGQVSDYLLYSQCRKEFKNLVKEKMKSNFEDELDPAIVSKKFWSHLKITSGTSRIPESVNYNGRFRNNPLDQSKLFNDYFSDQFSSASNYDIGVNFENDIINNIEINFRHVRKLLRSINVNKAPGPDGIHGKILKNCACSLAYPLSLLYKTSYNTGLIPTEWKLANIVPVHKKGSKANVENYRPISLTCLVMKIFEKIIRDELMLKCEHLLNASQHGFLPHRSCTTQLIPFSDSLAVSLNDNIRTDVVYFDFAKAFDSVNHDIILKKLRDNFAINGTLLKFLVNYLENRKQCVVIGGAKSGLLPVTSGVPQGSILGPLLFVIFINDMINCISPGTNIALYADDTKIWRKIQKWGDHDILQQDINKLYEWSVNNKMKFHPQKCKVLIVTLQSLNTIWDIVFPFQTYYYHLNGTVLEFTSNEVDLGVMITTRLSWRDQCLALFSKASSRLGLLKRVCHFVNSQKQKRILYLALVRSQFEHCGSIWRPCTEDMIQKLENIQRRGIKWILSEIDHHYNDLEYLKRLKDLDILPLREKFYYSDLVLFHKIYYGKSITKLPDYLHAITNEDRSRLRSNIGPPQYYSQASTIDLGTIRANRYDNLSLKCSIEPKVAAFKHSYFFRAHLLWNVLPVKLREIKEIAKFEKCLKSYLWDILLDPH